MLRGLHQDHFVCRSTRIASSRNLANGTMLARMTAWSDSASHTSLSPSNSSMARNAQSATMLFSPTRRSRMCSLMAFDYTQVSHP
ncbi:hypothetical protein, partial [Cupriavidus sp. SK-4]|uniref:hypothetical protein n=1 Tax=Cupriavidus sp. SK-4 TaxID=574750 RepID=UPI001F242263